MAAPVTKGVSETWRELIAVVQSDDQAALDAFEATLDERGLHPSFRSAIDAQLKIARGQHQSAWEQLVAASKERELGPHERLMRGLLFMEQGRLHHALEDLKAARRSKLWDPRVEGGIANIALERGDDEPAERFLIRSLEKAPEQWPERMKLCLVQRRMGKFQAALDSAARVTAEAPDFEDGWLMRAGILVDLGRAQEALALVLPVARDNEEWVRLRVAVVDILRANGRYDEAIGTLAPIAVKYGDPHLLMDLIELYLLVDQIDAADAMFELIEAIRVDSARIAFLQGAVAEAKGPPHHEEAMRQFEVAMAQDPTFWRAADALGSLLSLEGPLMNLARARDLYEQAAAHPERPVRPLLNLTLCWADDGLYEEAIAKVKEIVGAPDLRHEDKEHAKRVLATIEKARKK
jgi:tetratricopeptide (TPR) repeat protein